MRPRLLLVFLALSLLGACLAHADVIQRGNARVFFDGRLSPQRLPRAGAAPVRVAVSTRIEPLTGRSAPQLRRIEIAINRHGHLDTRGLPVCSLEDIQPSTTQYALSRCRRSLVGLGTFSAKLLVADAAPFPSHAKMYAFNGVIGCPQQREMSSGREWPSRSRTQEGRRGKRAPARDPKAADRGQRDAPCHPRPAILAHVYGTDPAPVSYTIPFEIRHTAGTYGLLLSAAFPRINTSKGYISGLSLDLGRNFSYRGARHSYLSAGCPAPPGVRAASFPFSRAAFVFKSRTLHSTLNRTCRPQ